MNKQVYHVVLPVELVYADKQRELAHFDVFVAGDEIIEDAIKQYQESSLDTITDVDVVDVVFLDDYYVMPVTLYNTHEKLFVEVDK